MYDLDLNMILTTKVKLLFLTKVAVTLMLRDRYERKKSNKYVVTDMSNTSYISCMNLTYE